MFFDRLPHYIWFCLQFGKQRGTQHAPIYFPTLQRGLLLSQQYSTVGAVHEKS